MPAIYGHTHTQASPSDEWTINHGLGYDPCVDVVVLHEGKMQKIIPKAVEYPESGRSVIVRFTSPRSGTARLA